MLKKRIGMLALLGLLLAWAPVAGAQVYPSNEFYFGFTMLNNEYGTDRHNSPGIVMNYGYSLTRNLRLIADFGAEFHNTNIVWTNGRHASADDYQLLFGPELAIRNRSKVTPFVHGLVGVAFRNYAVPSDNWTCNGITCYQDSFSVALEKGFASGVGGGIDWQFHPIVSARFVQFDWIRTNLSRDNVNYAPVVGQLPTLSGWQDTYRFSCRVTLRWGRRGTSE